MSFLLLVEDNHVAAGALKRCLVREGFGVSVAHDEATANELLRGTRYDLALLDVHLEDGTSFNLAQHIASESGIPVIFVTGSDLIDDKVAAFAGGAHDYVVKPFDHRELIARINANLRRWPRNAGQADSTPACYLFADYCLSTAKLAVFGVAGAVELSAYEFKLLQILVIRAPDVVRRDQINLFIHRQVHNPRDRTIDVMVARLRAKLGSGVIQTVRGEGYRLGLAVTTSDLDPTDAVPISVAREHDSER